MSVKRGLLSAALVATFAPSFVSALPLCFKPIDVSSSSLTLSSPIVYETVAGETFVVGGNPTNGHVIRKNVYSGASDDLTVLLGLVPNETISDVNIRGDILVRNINPATAAGPLSRVFISGAAPALIPSGNLSTGAALRVINRNGDMAGENNGHGMLIRSYSSGVDLSSLLNLAGYNVYQINKLADDGKMLVTINSGTDYQDAILVPDGTGRYNVQLLTFTLPVGHHIGVFDMNNAGDTIGMMQFYVNGNGYYFRTMQGTPQLFTSVPYSLDYFTGPFMPRSVANNRIVIGDYGTTRSDQDQRGWVFNMQTRQFFALSGVSSPVPDLDAFNRVGRAIAISKSGRTLVTRMPNGTGYRYYVLSQQLLDMDSDHTISVNDLFALLNKFFAADPDADVDGDGVVSVQDIFTYLNLFFGGRGVAC